MIFCLIHGLVIFLLKWKCKEGTTFKKKKPTNMFFSECIHVYVFLYCLFFRMLNEDLRGKESKISEMLRQNMKLSSQVNNAL